MWSRFKRAVRAFFGQLVSSMEDPERILQQNIRDLSDQVPRMNENIAMVRANVALLEKENARHRSELDQLSAKTRAAILAGRDDLAADHATRLASVQERLARNEAQLRNARAALEKALQLKEVFLREKERKTREALQAIRDHRRAQWQAKVADALASFRVGGIDQTHDEMIRRLEEKTAVNEARLEMALEAADLQTAQWEAQADRLRGEELVRRLKREMGMLEEPAAPIALPAGSLERKG